MHQPLMDPDHPAEPTAPPSRLLPLRDAPPLVDRVAVSVLMRVVAMPGNRWMPSRREVVAVLPVDAGTPGAAPSDDAEWLRRDGLALELHPDEAESYYLNLTGPDPRVFVVMSVDTPETPEPFIVTPSFDLASSYEQADHPIAAVELHPAIHAAIENHVLHYHLPERKRKRQRVDWKKP